MMFDEEFLVSLEKTEIGKTNTLLHYQFIEF